MLTTTTTTIFLTRILIALFTRTTFAPDEYYQSLEPAHHFIFGYGILTWEWSDSSRLRSIFYPFVTNVPVYWVLRETGLDKCDWALVYAPRVVHGALAALTDIGLVMLVKKTLGPRYVKPALWFSLTSIFHALALSRSLSNSLETSLASLAYAVYPWDIASFKTKDTRMFIVLAAVSCMVRPTGAVLWVYLFASLFTRLFVHRPTFLLSTLFTTLLIAFTAAATLFGIDTAYYGTPTFTPLRFLYTNTTGGVSLFYGSNAWHFYVTNALPILCGGALPYMIQGVVDSVRSTGTKAHKGRGVEAHTGVETQMLGFIAWTIGTYSLAGHKEWRFIHPLLPIFHFLASSSYIHKPRPFLFRSLTLLSILASLYIVLGYCSGPIEVMHYLRGEELGGGVGVLMPCHSIPGHAYLHREELREGGFWMLGCEPPFSGEDMQEYESQTDIFFASPLQYLLTHFPAQVDPQFPKSRKPADVPGEERGRWEHEWPKHLVMFGSLLDYPGVKELLVQERGYKEVWRGGRWWEGDGERRRGGVLVLSVGGR